jgi:hypothetical protein
MFNNKAIALKDRGDLQGYETSRPPYYLDHRLTDGDITIKRRLSLAPRKIPGTYFC